jgi:NAD(P)H-dependent FMN reductase
MGPPRDPLLQRWAAKVDQADGYVLVTPEYNHGYPAALKNALDVVFAPWNRKPVSFVSYGSAGGGLRAVEQLRLVSIELEMVPLRHQVAIPRVYAALDETGRPRDSHHAADARRLLDELAWWSAALRAARVGTEVAA